MPFRLGPVAGWDKSPAIEQNNEYFYYYYFKIGVNWCNHKCMCVRKKWAGKSLMLSQREQLEIACTLLSFSHLLHLSYCSFPPPLFFSLPLLSLHPCPFFSMGILGSALAHFCFLLQLDLCTQCCTPYSSTLSREGLGVWGWVYAYERREGVEGMSKRTLKERGENCRGRWLLPIIKQFAEWQCGR